MEVTALPEGPGDCLLALPHKTASEFLSVLVPQFLHLTSQGEVGRLWIQRDSSICHSRGLQLWGTLRLLGPAPGLVACPPSLSSVPASFKQAPAPSPVLQGAGKFHISMEIITRGV